TPRGPRCPQCPLQRLCRAYRLGRPEDFPPDVARGRSEAWLHIAALIRDDTGRILLARRSDDEEILPGLWHLPGLFLREQEAAGAVERLERHLQALLRRSVVLGSAAAEARHQITFRKIRALAYEGKLEGRLARAKDLRWTGNAAEDGLATSSLLGKLLKDAARPRQLELLD